MSYEFQFTHPRGVRRVEAGSFPRRALFQFTHPRGVRPAFPCRYDPPQPSFNSRTHEGCDFRLFFCCSISNLVSIHAPTRGATCHRPARIATRCVSIHAPTRGATADCKRRLGADLLEPTLAKVPKLSLALGTFTTQILITIYV